MTEIPIIEKPDHLFCSENQRASFDMIGASAMNELKTIHEIN